VRIVGGRYRGREIAAPDGRDTRPTADRAREGLFNILEHGIPGFRLPDAAVADIFAGSGALGLEALSRGAASVLFVESSKPAARIISANIKALRDEDRDRTRLLTTSADKLAKATSPLDLVLMDPPYRSGLATAALIALAERGWLHRDTVIVVEDAGDAEEFTHPGLEVLKSRKYGVARFTFLRQA
jgi:16S rRNA (guanine966-N2)-methyltransferase